MKCCGHLPKKLRSLFFVNVVGHPLESCQVQRKIWKKNILNFGMENISGFSYMASLPGQDHCSQKMCFLRRRQKNSSGFGEYHECFLISLASYVWLASLGNSVHPLPLFQFGKEIGALNAYNDKFETLPDVYQYVAAPNFPYPGSPGTYKVRPYENP